MEFIKKNKWEILMVLLFGVLLHFLFQWLGKIALVGIFSAVNESVWEHLKLLFYPMVLVAVYEKIRRWRYHAFLNFMATLIGMLFILVAYYTYSGIIGNHFMVVDILIFVGAVFLTFFIKYIGIENEQKELYGIFGFLFIMLLFILFTFFPSHIPLFFDSITATYGI